MQTFLITIGIIAVATFIVWLLSVRKLKSIQEQEETIMLNAWRKGLQRKDLVNCNGITYRIESIENGVVECTNYSDQKFILLTDLYPVE